jgi:hypothetical protein
MDDEQILRSLGEDLERDDPRLAALLDGQPPPRRRRMWRVLPLVVLPLLTGALLLPPTVAVGILAMLLVLVSPVVGILTAPGPPGGVAPGPG